MRRWVVLAALVLCAAGLSIEGCSQPRTTQLIVVVDTDYAIPTGIDEIDVEVVGTDGMHHLAQQPMASPASLPYTLSVVPSGAALGPIHVEARGLLGGSVVVARGGEVTLVAQQTLMVRLFLLRVCDHVVCTAPSTCGDDGTCRANVVSPEPWTGTAPRIGTDAGTRPDAGAGDGGAIDAGTRLDAGAIDGGAIDASASDAGPDCHATGCDDGNPCTDDACGADGRCTHANNTLACDDGIFCNGLDQCGGGSCSMHAGNPCGTTTCDETNARCGVCATSADCPAPIMGAFGACGGFATACGTSGMQSRTVRTFACTAGACVPTDTMDSQPCTRTTDGTMCGSTSCGAFGPCGGFASPCATAGTQTRTCTDMVCSGGTCGVAMRTEMAACTRGSTDGTTCMATSCGSFGACGGFSGTCGTAGTQSRTCTDYTCASGTCAPAMRSDMQACSRTTDGMTCMGTTCTAWAGTCSYVGDCQATGQMQTRTCTDYVCSGGSCAASPLMRAESQPCPTAPSGTVCTDPTIHCGIWQCNASGTCAQFSGACTGGRVCCNPPVCSLPTTC